MFTVWDVTARGERYDWQAVPAIRRPAPAGEWENALREPGDDDHVPRRPRGGASARGAAGPYARVAEQQAPSRRRVRTAEDLMTQPVVFLHPEDTVADAWRLIRERRFRHVPILSEVAGTERRRLVGIVSDRDVLRVAGTPDHRPVDAVGERPLRTLMNSPVFSALPGTPIRDIARVMFNEHIGSMPICSGSGELVGMLTRTDVLRSLLLHGPLELWI